MSLDQIIDSVKVRIDSLAREWNRLSSATAETSNDEMRLLKEKVSLVQEQNTVIIVELNSIKRLLSIEEDKTNNLFSAVVDTSGGALKLPVSTDNAIVITPSDKPRRKGTEWLPSIDRQRLPRPDSDIERLTGVNHDFSPLNKYPLAFSVHSFLNHSPSPWKRNLESLSPAECRKRSRPDDSAGDENEFTEYQRIQNLHIVESSSGKPIVKPQLRPLLPSNVQNIAKFKSRKQHINIKDFKFVMSSSPATISDMYQEYELVLRPQILDFEQRYGKGQLSKLPQVRTYQRRRALACEIGKYATRHDITIEESIQHFENIRIRNDKTVAWIYNNLTSILEQYC
ncbi:LAME_0D08108g1_1 [Lachancea meyersii CBS 8951]|uniref:LAME_0D08108g1_1 n=1 Tax=Lachancea meyersii CBS 8951 TaxID=1266667 RepID=A0A1G4JAA7_9SACH|nr:LAME_0D08108g1_1 [Lachancea meyersii CBS 8951]